MSETNYQQEYQKACILAGENADRKTVLSLKDRLKWDVITDPDSVPEDTLLLVVDSNGLSLKCGNLSYAGDYTHMLARLRPHNLGSEMLVKAAKIKGIGDSPTAMDATAGLGEDSLLLAAAGYHVTLYEADPVIAALLEDTIRRARTMPELQEIVARMTVIEGDSIEAMNHSDNPPDLILLDPMFPGRQKSGLVHKKFQLIHNLELPCNTEEEMIGAAIRLHPKRIVIKRPLKGPYLGNVKPSYSLQGKAIRYDCIALS